MVALPNTEEVELVSIPEEVDEKDVEQEKIIEEKVIENQLKITTSFNPFKKNK